jgi:hypothetical protein
VDGEEEEDDDEDDLEEDDFAVVGLRDTIRC